MPDESTPTQADLLPPENGKPKSGKKKAAEGKPQALTVQQAPPQEPAAPPSESGMVLLMIERAARDPQVDIDKLERLMRMQKDILEDQRKCAFFAALAKAQGELPQIVKTAENKQTNSKYAQLEKINEAMTPVITRHGFTLSFGTAECPKEKHHRITCEVGHSAGYVKNYEADLPIDEAGIQGNRNKTPIHAFASTMTYGRRILACLIFNVAVKGDDDDGNGAGGEAPGKKPTAQGMKQQPEKRPTVPDHANHWTDLLQDDVWKFIVMEKGHPFAGEPIWQVHNEAESFERAFKETPRNNTIDRHALDAAYATGIFRTFAKKRYVVSEAEEALIKTGFLADGQTFQDVPGDKLMDLATAVRDLPRKSQ